MSNDTLTPEAGLSQTLGRFDLLPLLPADIARALVDGARRRRFMAGQTIYCQGDTACELYRVLSGSVRILFIDRDGREVVYIHYEPNDCFGYSSLIDGKGLPHTAEAFTNVTLQIIGRDVFNAMRENRAFNDALLQLMCKYMRLLSTDVADAALDELSSRLALRLLEVARPDNTGSPTVRMSQTELGLMVGATRQWVNRLLREFQDDGLVQVAYGAVVLCDLHALTQRARGGR